MTEEEQIGEQIFELDQKIRGNELARRMLMIENMQNVIKMVSTRSYRAILGDDKADPSAYLAEIGIFYSRAKVRRWKRILEFLEQSSIEPKIIFDIPESRLEQIALVKDVFKTKDDALETLEKARLLIPRDWKNTLLELRGKPTLDDCKHENKTYEVCVNCGEKHLKNEE